MGEVDSRLHEDVVALASASDAVGRLQAIRRLRERVEAVETDLVAAARADGLSWTKIGAVYEMSKQGAQQRFRAATKRHAGRRGAGDKPAREQSPPDSSAPEASSPGGSGR